MKAHINPENIIPKGRSFSSRPASLRESFKAGNLKNIQRYMEPSKANDVRQRAQRRLSLEDQSVRSFSDCIKAHTLHILETGLRLLAASWQQSINIGILAVTIILIL